MHVLYLVQIRLICVAGGIFLSKQHLVSKGISLLSLCRTEAEVPVIAWWVTYLPLGTRSDVGFEPEHRQSSFYAVW